MACQHEVVTIAHADAELIQLDVYGLLVGKVGTGYVGVLTVETEAYQPAAGTMQLFIALTERGREREAPAVKGVVSIHVERFLLNVAFAHLYLCRIGFHCAAVGF